VRPISLWHNAEDVRGVEEVTVAIDLMTKERTSLTIYDEPNSELLSRWHGRDALRMKRQDTLLA